MDVAAAGTLDDEPGNVLPLQMLVATILEPSMVGALFEVAAPAIHLVKDPTTPAPATPAAPVAIAAPAAAAPLAPSLPETPLAALAPATPVAPTKAAAPATPVTCGEASLRVNVGVLETLMNLAGELVLSRNQLIEAIAREDLRAIGASGQRINLVTSELQDAIMLTRMQPIGGIFGKFPRVVRDLAKELGKEIELEMEGKDVEMDKTIIEGLSDPLTHMVRNAVDHGIESPAARRQAGKKATGTVHLKAYHTAGQVVIEISDDGKGIAADKVVASALTKGLITEAQAAALSEMEKYALIFLPGLSTAEKITDVSGRGVGMDVVKTNLDKLGGKVEITSEPGRGSTFRIKLPLTLAIIPSLLVSVAQERFAIPQVNVDELIRVRAEQVQERIEVIGDAEVLRLRGKLIPIVHLAQVLGMERTYGLEDESQREFERRLQIADRRSPRYPQNELTPAAPVAAPERAADQRRTPGGRRVSPRSDVNIVVVTAGTIQYALIVDELHDTVEIVVKPMGRHFKALREYAGATILGDGQVALILDVGGVATKVALTSVAASSRAQQLAAEQQHQAARDVQSLLLFRNAATEPCAVPLSLVARVEQIQASQINRLGGRRTMQYRGASLPLVALGDAAQVGQIDAAQEQVVIVFDIGGREIGLLAAKPLDVVETQAAIDQVTLRQKGVMGSLILKDQTTLLVDIFELVEAVAPDLVTRRRSERSLAAAALIPSGATTILLAEDSDFFRNQVKAFLESDGYKVLAAADGQAAWDLLQENTDQVQLVVTDIEMPRLSGLGLTAKIRQDTRVSHLPIIALTSLASEEDITKGKATGVTDYQIKLDKEALLTAVRRLLPHHPGKAAA